MVDTVDSRVQALEAKAQRLEAKAGRLEAKAQKLTSKAAKLNRTAANDAHYSNWDNCFTWYRVLLGEFERVTERNLSFPYEYGKAGFPYSRPA